jgi:hypothetical protein
MTSCINHHISQYNIAVSLWKGSTSKRADSFKDHRSRICGSTKDSALALSKSTGSGEESFILKSHIRGRHAIVHYPLLMAWQVRYQHTLTRN